MENIHTKKEHIFETVIKDDKGLYRQRDVYREATGDELKNPGKLTAVDGCLCVLVSSENLGRIGE